MSDDERQTLLTQMAELRSEMRRARLWQMVTAFGVFVLLFWPSLPQRIVQFVLSILGTSAGGASSAILNILAIVVVVFIGAVFVSRRSHSPARENPDN